MTTYTMSIFRDGAGEQVEHYTDIEAAMARVAHLVAPRSDTCTLPTETRWDGTGAVDQVSIHIPCPQMVKRNDAPDWKRRHSADKHAWWAQYFAFPADLYQITINRTAR
ncbi:MAG TPA: hypothetical protein VK634_19710 [Reyranella sp.]|nr:hypothetical protein [Reyranella sp.]HTE82922.1 hypothetical protein [Reyranella sp.]